MGNKIVKMKTKFHEFFQTPPIVQKWIKVEYYLFD